METGFLSLQTYLFNLLTFVKRPGKEQAAHGVIPRKKNKISVNNLPHYL